LSSEPLRREIGLFGAVMLVMGGIIGAGIFRNPALVAKSLHAPPMILLVWCIGGVIGLLGGFVYAELAERIPDTGGEYAYLSKSYGPLVGFLFGWTLLLVVQTGGMAAVTKFFAENFNILTGWNVPEPVVIVAVLGVLTLVNCLGVKSGNETQSVLGVLKIGAIIALIACGLFLAPKPQPLLHPLTDGPMSSSLLSAFGAALIPVVFAFGGWQTANFVGGEMRKPSDLALALVIGVLGVTALYLAVNLACLNTLGADKLGHTDKPAADVLTATVGPMGGRLVAAAIALSTLGYLGQSLLTAPRVFYVMARDGYLIDALGKVSSKSHVPVRSIVLTGVLTGILALSGSYKQIIAYDVSMNFVFFALTTSCLFVLRARDKRDGVQSGGFRVPGHPFTTIAFLLACVVIVVATHVAETRSALVGDAILLVGVPYYYVRRMFRREKG
jgi:APA family basic amino acid/polyamine antiporter